MVGLHKGNLENAFKNVSLLKIKDKRNKINRDVFSSLFKVKFYCVLQIVFSVMQGFVHLKYSYKKM